MTHPDTRAERLWYAGHEPTEPPLARGDGLAEDEWYGYMLWLRWLDRRGYRNRVRRNRGYRRAVARKRQEARTRFYRLRQRYFGERNDPADAARLGRRFRDLRQPCSCPFCGNARRWFGKATLQERKDRDAQEA